jgi:pyruvate dehydrogenase complex dehydrogenase (E1) component
VARFGQSGNRIDLYREYGLDAGNIEKTCRQALLLDGKPMAATGRDR